MKPPSFRTRAAAAAAPAPRRAWPHATTSWRTPIAAGVAKFSSSSAWNRASYYPSSGAPRGATPSAVHKKLYTRSTARRASATASSVKSRGFRQSRER